METYDTDNQCTPVFNKMSFFSAKRTHNQINGKIAITIIGTRKDILLNTGVH